MTPILDLLPAIERVVADADLGRASARRAGRTQRWPYVPIILWTDGVGTQRQRQIRGRAYTTRDEAVAAAQHAIDRHRKSLGERLADPRHRAEREQYGLPREISR